MILLKGTPNLLLGSPDFSSGPLGEKKQYNCVPGAGILAASTQDWCHPPPPEVALRICENAALRNIVMGVFAFCFGQPRQSPVDTMQALKNSTRVPSEVKHNPPVVFRDQTCLLSAPKQIASAQASSLHSAPGLCSFYFRTQKTTSSSISVQLRKKPGQELPTFQNWLCSSAFNGSQKRKSCFSRFTL